MRKTPIKSANERERIRAKLMLKARPIAARGSYTTWRGVVEQLSEDERRSAFIWLSSHDKDELDRICDRTRIRYR